MEREEVLKIILDSKIVAIIRMDDSEKVYTTAEALYNGGVDVIEITMCTPNVLDEIRKLSRHSGILPGVGSVTNPQMVVDAVAAGAEFIVTPATKQDVIEAAHELNKPICCGAYTPTEVLQAYEWGADIVKLFPAAISGIPYFKAIGAPMPYIPIMPTGGITVENAAEWLKAGAVSLGVGSTLANKKLIEQNDFQAITDIARSMRVNVDGAVLDYNKV
ncbi:MAG: 2-dehydro-3-deoxyphosphogluconate aldolase/(4S)-4-hydroxy-2-oxoglutarate aldolase [Saprospiraceae bacterium]|jgi:2-dehydro-3-deoxyphosphogluconate aldolase/(4S)-4-hydroxy-2-oxoglutarate aldolase